MPPAAVVDMLFRPNLFSADSTATLSDKSDLYFHDPELMPLFVHENYLHTSPSRVRVEDGPHAALKQLRLMDKAATSISDGDLADTVIRGYVHNTFVHYATDECCRPDRCWSIMPLHAVWSTVQPAFLLHGMGLGYGTPRSIAFPQCVQ